MRYRDFTITITPSQADNYFASADAGEAGRVPVELPLPDQSLRELLAQVTTLAPDTPAEDLLDAAGEALYRWLFGGALREHLVRAWERAAHAGQGLRIRLCLDAPEIAAWPWELLRDGERCHTFATALTTPLVRFYNRADQLGGLADLATELPLHVLLVLPSAAGLDLAHEEAAIREALATLGGAVSLRVLAGNVTRRQLADTLLAGHYDIVHFSGHGAYANARGYVQLLQPDGTADWIDGSALAQLSINYSSIKLVVLNACSTGQTDAGRAFSGLALQMVRHGIPAIIAMQFPLTDQAATTFAREFYRHLCLSEDAGQVDAAITYARSLMAVMHPGDRSFAAPALYTRAPDGVIFTLPNEPAVRAVLEPNGRRARLAMLITSLDNSQSFSEDWALAPRQKLLAWRTVLERAEQAYAEHLADPHPDVQQAARNGLTLLQTRLTALEQALATA